MHLALLLNVYLSLALGAVIDTRYACRSYDDTYDDITTSPSAVTSPPFANYNGLLYQGWTISDHSSPLSSVIYHTKPNVVIANAVTDLRSIGTVTLYPFGNVLRSPTTKSFDLTSFFFGCSQVTSEGVAGVPVGCIVAVTGYDVPGRQIAVETFSFAPTAQLLNARMNAAVLPSRFSGLQNVTFGLVQGGGSGGAVGTTIVVDDVVHCNFV